MIEHPPLDAVQAVVKALRDRGLACAIGGSGLLAALGLTDRVRDWDVTTDASVSDVVAALNDVGLPFREADSGPPWATAALFVVDAGNHEVEVMVSFAMWVDGHIVPFPTRVTRSWQGLPIADPAVWLSAYELMGRRDSADLLRNWLSDHPRV